MNVQVNNKTQATNTNVYLNVLLIDGRWNNTEWVDQDGGVLRTNISWCNHANNPSGTIEKYLAKYANFFIFYKQKLIFLILVSPLFRHHQSNRK